MATALPAFVTSSCHLTESLDGMAAGIPSGLPDASDATSDLTDQDVQQDADAADVAVETSDSSDPDVMDADASNDSDEPDVEDEPLEDAPDDGTEGSTGPCAAGVCGGSCADCDGDDSNGCETDLSTDALHCGSCQHSCDGYACDGGMCEIVEIVTDAHMPWDLAVDGSDIYWVEEGPSATEGRVVKTPEQGGSSQPLAQAQASPIAVAIDDAAVFWVNFTSGGTISRVAKTGTGYAQLAVSNAPRTIALDSERVFWTTMEGAVVQVPKAGGSPTTMAQQGAGIVSLFVFGERLYWVNRLEGKLLSMDKADTSGASTAVLASGLSNPTAVYVDADRVYWLEAGPSFDGVDCFQAEGRISSTSRLSPGTVEELALDQACPTRITGDGSHVYWSNQGTIDESMLVYRFDGSVARAESTGTSGSEILAAAQLRPKGIALGATTVFWVTQGLGVGQGTVSRVAK